MGVELARAYINVRANSSGVKQDLNDMKDGVTSSLNELGGTINAILGAILSAGITKGIIATLLPAGEFEQTTIAFETMIGSVTETKRTLADLTEFAAKTPFEMPEILQAARGLIQFGERGDDLMQTLHMLGNAAAGTSTQFGMVALIFNQIRGVGYLLTQDFRQLSTRGIISLQDIAKYYKVTTAEAQNMLSAGRISFADFKKIMASLSEEGGRFHNLMERQSTSLLGLWSTFKDSINLVKRAIGETLLPVAGRFLKWAISIAEVFRDFAQNNQTVVRILAELAIVVGTLVTVFIAWSLAMRAAAAAKVLLLALSGPAGWVAIGVGIGVAVAAIEVMRNSLDNADKSAKQVRDSLLGVADTSGKIKGYNKTALDEYNLMRKKRKGIEENLKQYEEESIVGPNRGGWLWLGLSSGKQGELMDSLKIAKQLEEEAYQRYVKENAHNPEQKLEEETPLTNKKEDTRAKFEDLSKQIQDMILSKGIENKIDQTNMKLDQTNQLLGNIAAKPPVQVGLPK